MNATETTILRDLGLKLYDDINHAFKHYITMCETQGIPMKDSGMQLLESLCHANASVIAAISSNKIETTKVYVKLLFANVAALETKYGTAQEG